MRWHRYVDASPRHAHNDGGTILQLLQSLHGKLLIRMPRVRSQQRLSALDAQRRPQILKRLRHRYLALDLLPRAGPAPDSGTALKDTMQLRGSP
eukprot:CAMPEP_0169361662 /NCGR_PEP_ID=MMETSP1017-20121227/30475_1 /TAXON_ID=342587 /ORGANISM="Karlodinium micrum, Strain CCMP2283" /LENGTH=93 /DNA_ID=CAMNT_0009459091 /DNA_START=1291 /DNA_END=1572 /DNA_ORIENTATION=+